MESYHSNWQGFLHNDVVMSVIGISVLASITNAQLNGEG